MVKVCYSHLCEESLKNIKNDIEVYDYTGNLLGLISLINDHHPGFRNLIIDSKNSLLSSCAIYSGIQISPNQQFFDTVETQLIQSVNGVIKSEDTLLFSIYNPLRIQSLLEDTIQHPITNFHFFKLNTITPQTKDYRQYIDQITGPICEVVKDFQRGKCSLNDLKYDENETISLEFQESNDIFDIFQRKKSKTLPKALVNAFEALWELDAENIHLRRHQEDSLFFILGMLRYPQKLSSEALLLSIPTGGGKTESFFIPTIAHIYDIKNKKRETGDQKPRVKVIIIYPTKALANDQANRFVDILHEINKFSRPYQKITLGIFTGDTPNKAYKLRYNNIIQLCPNCNSSVFDYDSEQIRPDLSITFMKCKRCENEMHFLRLTREDIIQDPPDILITNLDMINQSLQNPQYHQLFSNPVDLVIFDEIHQCESIFGCHAGHLLRRLEMASHSRPLYVGVSATIHNAKDLASILFDVDEDKILYLNEIERPYLSSDPHHYRYHYVLTPHEWAPEKYMQVLTSTLNCVDILAHSIKDPHFRKTLIFCNYRQDTDDFIKDIREQEERYFGPYQEDIRQRIQNGNGLNQIEQGVALAVGCWYEYLESCKSLYTGFLEIGWHRGGLEQEERLKSITRFSTSKKIQWADDSIADPIDIMVATKTLELGIDIGDVTNVFNLSSPFTTNEYVQRVGRGGRKKDASAITVLDPSNPLDFYFRDHFNIYANPHERVFEDAPIIITNESIVKSHIHAIILDFLADRYLENRKEIKVENLQELTFSYKGASIRFMDHPEQFAELIFDTYFNSPINELDGSSLTMLQRYQRWFAREHAILGVDLVEIDKEKILSILQEKCREIRDAIRSEHLKKFDPLNGMSSKVPSLTPNLRASGISCNIKLNRERDYEIKDKVSRRRVLTSMPKGGFASQGANTFKVEDYERDPNTETKIKETLYYDREASSFFKKQFLDHFPDSIFALDVQTPSEVKVRYYPFRFYCTGCGRTYTHLRSIDNRCECGKELRQITELYVCGNDNCWKVYEPPVPKVCINPEHLRRDPEFLNSVKQLNPKYEKFRFKALPGLNWQCRECKAIWNYHKRYMIEGLPQKFLAKPFSERSFDDADGIAKHYQYRPESTKYSKHELDKYGINYAHYTCEYCGTGKVQAQNIPTIRTSLQEFIVGLHGQKNNVTNLISPSKDFSVGSLTFLKVDVIALGREYSQSFYKGEKPQIKTIPIFDTNKPNSFVGNHFSTHAMGFDIHESLLNEFLISLTECNSIKCEQCTKIQTINRWKDLCPRLKLEEYEKVKTSDIRRKWCNKIPERKCTRDYCDGCPEFIRTQHLKYLLLHSLKHALILAMPKYVGVNKNEVRGIIYPNDKTTPQILFLDVHEDGCGSVFLMRRHWEQIWKLSRDLMKNANENKGTLMLPLFCERYNMDLCPIIGVKFFEFLESRGLM